MADQSDTVTFLGDVFLPEPAEAAGLFTGPLVLNLEAPITTRDTPVAGKILLRTRASHLMRTFGQKPLAVCLANNHILDYGAGGLADTMAGLEQEGIPYFAAGPAERNHGNPMVVQVAGKRLALLGYVCPTTHPSETDAGWIRLIDEAAIMGDIAHCREQAVDRIVVSLHWGEQGCWLPRREDALLAHRLIDAGADLIIGHHSHCRQGYEVYRGRHIFYGLGNCIFPDFDVLLFDSVRGIQFVERCVWRHWNNRSIAVRYDPVTNRCEPFGMRLLANRRLRSAGRVDVYRIDTTVSDYGKRLDRARALGALRDALGRFLSRPKVPRLHNIRALSGWMKRISH